jgi:sugar phosphate isomerase/epimerase
MDEVVGLIDEVGRDNVGVVFDTWHMWDSPGVHEGIARWADRIFGVQISDYRDPPRGGQDRLYAGDGVAHIEVLLRELRNAGFDGWYDMELFSDDGRFGNLYPDSLWKLPRDGFAIGQVEGFRRCWEASFA